MRWIIEPMNCFFVSLNQRAFYCLYGFSGLDAGKICALEPSDFMFRLAQCFCSLMNQYCIRSICNRELFECVFFQIVEYYAIS